MRPNLSWIVLVIFGLGNLVLPSLHHRYAHSHSHAQPGHLATNSTQASGHGACGCGPTTASPGATDCGQGAECGGLAAQGGSGAPEDCGQDCAVCHALGVGALPVAHATHRSHDVAPRDQLTAPRDVWLACLPSGADRPRGPPLA